MFFRQRKDSLKDYSFNYVIVDTDVGGDDAQALIVLDYFVKKHGKKLLGITTCDGNATIQNVIKNVLVVEAICQSNYPVYPGLNTSIAKQNQSDGYFGKDGLCDQQEKYLNIVKINENLVQKERASKFIAEMAQKYKNQIAIICLGPLTNLALAYHYSNQIKDYFSCVSVLGSADTLIGLNEYFAAEFNFALDPEAASCVLRSFSNIMIASLETAFFTFSKEEINILFKKTDTEKGKFVMDIYSSKQSPILADPLSIVALFRPELIKSGMYIKANVNTKGRRTRGCIMIDYFSLESQKPNCYLIKQFDNKKLVQQIENSYI